MINLKYSRILSQETNPSWDLKNVKSYIAASYVKFVESSGARVIPIRIASDMNNNNDYFPIMGICLGFELLSFVASGAIEHRFKCSSSNQVLPLEFSSDFKTSSMFKDAPQDIIDILKIKKVTANFHSFCINENSLIKVNLTGILQILSTNYDLNNNKFISSFEHRNLPYYALQFHPEKNIYEWSINKKIPHTFNAIKISQYFSNFFIEQARKSSHTFPIEEEVDNLIYHYNATYTAVELGIFEQVYFFNE
ncbi:hypothetical protein HCN44_001367 [Aphidius gifuensis]|uniref:folate gamma-glutamyl hydrolase n=1 Tax=Aphidius gifuensis TaxID=684658 RepID=A0A835CQ98_APHGI|nr:hypothetical protein HCN44_001367 [Aphidius gifuensis]